MLDVGGRITQDCFSHFTGTKEAQKPSGTGAKIKMPITVCHEGREKEIDTAVDAAASIGPTSAGKRPAAFETSTLATEAADGITAGKALQI